MAKKTTSNVLTKDEVKTINVARKILKKLSLKHQKLIDEAFDSDVKTYDDTKLVDFEDSLYKQAKIDFYSNDDAFIDLA